ncbi:unnamed protein product [Brassicogethes aeneus]|uniref:Uncharacterized protein n=1 Tax=Brassicogethes aeneus TaxID=1431903 RepID=A0A9P0B5T2_BRAAE|nr:unnamed protein product [Brassicogethes aeneus]
MQIFIIYITLHTILIPKIFCNVIIENENCTKLQDEFAKAVSNFTSCGVFHSRPINICEKCVDSYLDLDQTYRKMNELAINDSKCIDYFVGQDRLQIVHTLYMASVNLWEEAKCSKCFDVVNGQLTNNLSADTETFLKLYKKNCCLFK